ncbi:lysine--tRNA ligase [Candidatus Woesearchaeota archaeon]|nr:lysine--tRNA ligase [Candidatus Woesearchaeota archaeon]
MMPESHLVKERKKKLTELKKSGINPYAYSYPKSHDANSIKENFKKYESKKVSVAGRIISMRSMGKLTFIDLQDQSGRIQLLVKQDNIKNYDLLRLLDNGDIIGCKGTVFKTKRGEISVDCTNLDLLSKSLRPLPEKWHGLKDAETRYRQRYLDLIMNPEVKEIFIKRAKIYQAIREFLDKHGFIEVQTPILQTQYGGANARPFVTKINAWNIRMYLRIAYEMHLKRLMVGGFEKIYDMSSCFRNEGVDKTHNPEFAMIEIQQMYADYNDMMKLTEELWEYVAKKVLGTTKIEHSGNIIELKAPWKRITMHDAIKELAAIDTEKFSDKELAAEARKHKIEIAAKATRGEIVIALFENLCEHKLIQPTHIVDHPVEACPLAKQHRSKPGLIERVEPFINGWEIGNGYSELINPEVQKKHLEEQAEKGRGGDEEAHPMDKDYINALEYGLPPNAGMGIGIDRMVILLTGADSIRDVTLFPIMKPK